MLAHAKTRSIVLLMLAEVAGMGLWFVSSAVLPEMSAEAHMTPGAQAALTSAVQIGFVAGALAVSILGLADRFDPRHVFLAAVLVAAAANAGLLVTPVGGIAQIGLRAVVGAALAGVYPVGMKIAVGWGLRDRGFLVGLLVGALTLGSAAPHLIALVGGADWRVSVAISSVFAAIGGLLIVAVALGPHHARAAAFDPGAVRLAWSNRAARLAIAGYLGHMWELYAFWAWVAAAAAASFALQPGMLDAEFAARITAFVAVALGGLACAPAGLLADRFGKSRIAMWCMVASGSAALASAASFGGPVWLTALCLVAWGVTVIPDSAQFSALVADAVPAERAGSLMTFQTALGFSLTAVTVQVVPSAAASFGWPTTLALMALGPALGVEAMRRLTRAIECADRPPA